jgi:hypothetical protein
MTTATATKTEARAWTCARCEVTIRWMPGHERAGLPQGWMKKGGEAYCLGCRRALAADAAVAAGPADASLEDRAKQRRIALIEFEIDRDPERPNGEIARTVRCSVPAVVKARQRMANR